MKVLLQDDVKHVEDKIKLFEANTGCELLIVVTESSDEYPGAIWRFGIVFGFVITLLFSLFFEFHHGYFWPLSMFILSLLGAYLGHFEWAKRFALSDKETHRETYEKAVECFHSLGTSKVKHKVTAMIMISIFEKRIMVLVDEKLKKEITQPELDELVTIMQPHFKQGNMGMGLIESISSLEEKILKDFGGKVSDANPQELQDTIHFL